MKKILVLALMMTLILSGCSLAEKRYVKDNSDQLEKIPVSNELYTVRIIKATNQMIKAAQTIKANSIQVGLGSRDYKEDIEIVETHLEDIQNTRNEILSFIPDADKEDDRESLIEAIDAYSAAVSTHLDLIKKDEIDKDVYKDSIDDLTTKMRIVKLYSN